MKVKQSATLMFLKKQRWYIHIIFIAFKIACCAAKKVPWCGYRGQLIIIMII
jgi:hypothetical protein